MKIYHYATAGIPLADVLVTHGLAEHHRRYFPFIQALNEAGFDVYSYDQRSHGETPGPRAQVDVARLVSDHLRIRELISVRSRTGKLFLFGHSMGGLVTAASALKNPAGLLGVVLSGPAVSSKLPQWLVPVASVVAKYFPGLRTLRLAADEVALRPEVVDAYLEDPLNYTGPVPLLIGVTITGWANFVHANASRWAVPLLVLHGEHDTLTDPAGSAFLVEQAVAAGCDATHLIVEGEKHEVFNGDQAPQLRALTVEWLQQHL